MVAIDNNKAMTLLSNSSVNIKSRNIPGKKRPQPADKKLWKESGIWATIWLQNGESSGYTSNLTFSSLEHSEVLPPPPLSRPYEDRIHLLTQAEYVTYNLRLYMFLKLSSIMN